jgi:hypothetical protein
MSPADAVPIALLLLFGVALGIGGTIVWLAIRWNRQALGPLKLRSARPARTARPEFRRRYLHFAKRPVVWLAIRSRNPLEVQAALALADPTPCSWTEGWHGENRLFIAPPIRGWVLVAGSGLPDPAEDVDCCFRLLRELSRKLGHVQFFHADRVLHHHAWARLEAGRVVRAYAWAGATLWNQGAKAAAETELGLKCFSYGEDLPRSKWGVSELLTANVEKVPLLAERWSLDPAELEARMLPPARGIAGRPSVRY